MKKRPEPTTKQVSTWIRNKRFFAPADRLGEPAYTPASDGSIGILYADPQTPPYGKFKTWLFGEPPRAFIGVIFFWAPPNEGCDWRFHVYGRKYFELALGFADELHEEFGKNVKVTLVSEKTLNERNTPISLLGWPY